MTHSHVKTQSTIHERCSFTAKTQLMFPLCNKQPVCGNSQDTGRLEIAEWNKNMQAHSTSHNPLLRPVLYLKFLAGENLLLNYTWLHRQVEAERSTIIYKLDSFVTCDTAANGLTMNVAKTQLMTVQTG